MRLLSGKKHAVLALSSMMILGAVACGSTGDTTEPKEGSGSGGFSTGAGGGGHGGAATTSSGAAGSTGDSGGGGAPPKKGPPYPMVLAHGFFGFNDFAGAGFLTYFYDVKKHLEAKGEIV